MFKNLKIGTKLIISFSVIVILISAVFYYTNSLFLQKEVEQITMMELNYAKSNFSNLQEQDTKILSSALEAIIQDPGIKQAYLEKDRDALYAYVNPLFENLKTKYGITHWYFILPDGHTFLRAHNKDIYGDEIERFTFLKARDTKNVASGIELGKTAYALRVVMPYYNGSELIGYLELGEEIEHFLTILKGETNNGFSIVADKKYLSREDWTSIRQVAGLPDNWDDIQEHVVIAGTAKTAETSKCFSKENFELIEKGDDLLQQIQIGNKIYECSGFEIFDAGGQHSGSTLAFIDITKQIGMTEKVKQQNIIFALAIFIISLFISILLSLLLSNPIKKLMQVSQDIIQGDLNARAEVTSKDEIGILAQSFNAMTDSLIETRKLPENIIRSMADSLMVVTPEAKIKEVNQATLELLGYERKELLGQPIEKVFGRAAAAAAAAAENIFRGAGLEKLIKEGFVKDVEMTYQPKKGEKISVSISGSVMKDEKGKMVGIVVVAKDMRLLKKLEEQRVAAAAAAAAGVAIEKAKREIAEKTANEIAQKVIERDAANQQLRASNQQVNAANQQLAALQKNLQDKLLELERFNKVAVGRELKMIELKEEIARLKGKA